MIAADEAGSRASYNVLERMAGVLFEVAHALADIRNGRAFQNLHDGVANLFHNAADAAGRFVRAGAFFIKPGAHAANGRERSFDVSDDSGELNFVRWHCEPIAARNSAFALHNFGALKVVQYLIEETLG